MATVTPLDRSDRTEEAREVRRLMEEAGTVTGPSPESTRDVVADMVSDLVEDRSFLANILESSTEYSIIAKDMERRILSWNAGARRNYGYAPVEVLGKPSDMLHTRSDIESGIVDRLHAEALAKGRAIGTFRRKRKDGTTFTASVVITRREDANGKPIGYLVISRDVTEEESLRRSAEESRRFLDNILDSSTEYSIIAKDLDRRILSWNAGARRNYGYEADEIVGQSSDILHEEKDLRSGIIDELHRKALEKGQAEGIFHRRRKDGTTFTASVVITRRLGASGEPVGYLIISRDVTTEEALRRAAEEDRRRLAEADRRKDEFLATLAHELRNPLAPLAMAAETLARPGVPEDVKARQLGVLTRQVQHLTRLVNDLLDAARIYGDKVDIQRSRVDLRPFVEQGVEIAQPLVEQKRHHLAVHLPQGAVIAYVDGARIAQAVGNLVQNAAKYTPPGGRIEVHVETQGPQACISVQDNGYGIPTDLRDRVFEVFMQAHTHQARGGLGLGLSVVKKIVELHGGSVAVASDGLGRGSRFTICLPSEAPQAKRRADGPMRVLVVDDVPDVADAIADLLRLEGMSAVACYGGEEALESARDLTPDAVVCDIGMPEMDGYEVAQRLRSEPATSGCLLIALTGYSQDRDRAKAKGAGFDHHVAKPPDMKQMLTLLKSRRVP